MGQLLVPAGISLVNFVLHAIMTGLIVVATRHIARATDDFSVFIRVAALMVMTTTVLACTHVAEVSVWATYYAAAGVTVQNITAFEFAFENYTALGYGDAVPQSGHRLIGPITALNGLLLIGWSVAIIFEVLRMADVHVGRRPAADNARR